jgi:hypothetical protein
MGKKKGKLSVKKETLRKLDTLTDDQLRAAAGGTQMAIGGGNVMIGGIRGPSRPPVSGGCETTTAGGFNPLGGGGGW